MPNYSISVKSDTNMLFAEQASKLGMTVEKYCAVILAAHGEDLRKTKVKSTPIIEVN